MVAIILYLFSSLSDGYRSLFGGTNESDEHKQEENVFKLLDDINEFYSVASYGDSSDYYNEKSFFMRDEVFSFNNKQGIVTPPSTCKDITSLSSERAQEKNVELLEPKKKVESVKAEELEEFDLQKRIKIKQKAKNNENFEMFKMLNEKYAKMNSQKVNDGEILVDKVVKDEPSVNTANDNDEEKNEKEIKEEIESKFVMIHNIAPLRVSTNEVNVKPVSDEIVSIIKTEVKHTVNSDEKKPLQQQDEVVSSIEEVLYLSNDEIKKMLQNAPKKSSLNESFIKETKPSSIPRPTKRLSFKEERHLYALQRETSDTMDYRLGYPGLKDNSKLNDNVGFLLGKIKSRPNGDYIDNIHKNWWGNYKLLSQQVGYIQWLFPIRIQGTNYDSHALQKHELDTLKSKDNIETVQSNLLKSYEMMLDFYGIQFVSRETGKLKRSDNYKDRYDNLSRNLHNSLHITRILKCLGEFEMELYQVGFLEFMLEEIFVRKELEGLNDGLTRYWIHVVKDDTKRNELITQAKALISKGSL